MRRFQYDDPGFQAAFAAFLDEHERTTCCERWAQMLGELVEQSLPIARRPLRIPDSQTITATS